MHVVTYLTNQLLVHLACLLAIISVLCGLCHILLPIPQDPANKESLIVIQQILPGSTAAHCQQLSPGDHILAIDEQLLDGADYLM